MRGASALIVVLWVGACDSPQDHYPINPGGGGGGGGGGPVGETDDAGVNDAPTSITIRVCLITDLRNVHINCADTGANDIQVLLESANVNTAADGTATLVLPQDPAKAQYAISRADLVTTIVPFTGVPSTTMPILPVIKTTGYDALLTANGVVTQGGRGTILLEITKGGTPNTGATAAITAGEDVPRYDTASATIWGTTSTGAKGIAWMPNNDQGPRQVTIAPTGATARVQDIEITADAITFITAEF